ncbi:hypothetical protein F4678DRAFT_463907 [Xylaria arbuscula]|nr:hypothetical protein F4678DRAFT_463907 [Xylaria arbuscula]
MAQSLARVIVHIPYSVLVLAWYNIKRRATPMVNSYSAIPAFPSLPSFEVYNTPSAEALHPGHRHAIRGFSGTAEGLDGECRASQCSVNKTIFPETEEASPERP